MGQRYCSSLLLFVEGRISSTEASPAMVRKLALTYLAKSNPERAQAKLPASLLGAVGSSKQLGPWARPLRDVCVAVARGRTPLGPRDPAAVVALAWGEGSMAMGLTVWGYEGSGCCVHYP